MVKYCLKDRFLSLKNYICLINTPDQHGYYPLYSCFKNQRYSMKKLLVLLIPMLMIFMSWQTPAPNPRPQRPPVNQDSLAKARQEYVQAILAEIKGKENMRADSVFLNIQVLKVPAERMLRIMDQGWSKSLGVGCEHCHNVNKWSDEVKPDKQLARDMAKMTSKINSDMLRGMKGVGEKTNINCNTCHRGQKHP
jgi:hypothetical protein